MTRKDYIKIASIIKNNSIVLDYDEIGITSIGIDKNNLVKDFVIMFKKDNESFDKERFIKACQ
mgnify:CR=1 FL=1